MSTLGPTPNILPNFVYYACTIASTLSLLISLYSIIQQLLNYRKPQEQRLIIRIQFMVPIFCVTCWFSSCLPSSGGLISTKIAKLWISPIQEFYESFVIYTFFSLLTLILGGERKIMLDLAWDKPLIRHPIFILGKLLPPIDISDPKAFLNIKRGILQYVWFKPFYCLGMLIVELASGTDTSNKTAEWCVFLKNYLIIFYNISASLSLYDLALFWKCLYGDLAAHNPWPKFLCVKLIIFASYWQGTLIGILNHFGFWNGNDIDGTEDIGFVYQNAILCIEMIGFSVGHLIAFSFSPYTYKAMPNCGRMKFKFAVRDCFGIGDLAYDFKTTFLGKIYNYKNFDSIENVRLMRNNSHSSNRLRNARVTEGLRVINGGRDRYWIDTKNNSRIDNNRSSVLSLVGDQQQKLLYASNHQGYDSICSIESSTIRTDTGSNIGSEDLITTQSDMIHQNLNSIESEPLVDILEGVDSKYVPQDPNYPVTWDVKGYKYTTDIERLRDSLVSR